MERRPEPAALAALPADPEPSRERLRVVIIEDNRDAAEALRLLLDLYGHDVTVAHTGTNGIQAALHRPPDVVLCDIGLPDVDGWEVARVLRRHPTTAAVRLIALTAYGSEQDRRRSRAAGFNFHVTKPADPETLELLLTRPSG
jgi:CheY-like chemotaxis protein